jgi:hypothetical protein
MVLTGICPSRDEDEDSVPFRDKQNKLEELLDALEQNKKLDELFKSSSDANGTAGYSWELHSLLDAPGWSMSTAVSDPTVDVLDEYEVIASISWMISIVPCADSAHLVFATCRW